MTAIPEFDGPRPLRRNESAAAHRLFRVCFSNIAADDREPAGGAAEGEETPSDEPVYESRGETHIIAAQGRPVSMISIFHERLHACGGLIRIGSIGGVCTHPHFRGHGLATRLLEHCTRRLAEGGAQLLLISGGRGLYTRAGCTPAGRFAGFCLRPGEAPPPGRGVVLRPLETGDALDGSRLYQTGQACFERSLAQFTSSFSRPPGGYHAEQWMVEMDGRPAGYLLLTVPWEYVGRPELGVREVFEYAGSSLALAGGLAAALHRPGIREVRANIAWQDFDLIRLLREAGFGPQWSALPDHTFRIINFPRLMAALRPYLRARLEPRLLRGLRFEQRGPLLRSGGEDGLLTIARGKDRLTLAAADMTRLVMGSPDGPDAGSLQAPGAVKDIAAALFPLPSFLPGLNYH